MLHVGQDNDVQRATNSSSVIGNGSEKVCGGRSEIHGVADQSRDRADNRPIDVIGAELVSGAGPQTADVTHGLRLSGVARWDVHRMADTPGVCWGSLDGTSTAWPTLRAPGTPRFSSTPSCRV